MELEAYSDEKRPACSAHRAPYRQSKASHCCLEIASGLETTVCVLDISGVIETTIDRQGEIAAGQAGGA